MSNSYRIRTTPGVDKSVKVTLEQDFEFLEILSLKVLQSQVYTRVCSDYGVIVGRVSVNNGFGIPNAKVSVFIPLEDSDSGNPVITELYPYKTLSTTNDDGYRYNLLPTEPSYSNHIPTGSFFTREDVLTNPNKIEVYDKYYKYNAVTNESGDYMIFGVPVGSQTIVVNVDLSDIGEFSLSPQDLIRMGVATPNQVNGTKFRASSNLNELPQIITINRTLEVEPLWGDTSVCTLGITRTDFDLSAEKNINIKPTAIFMGSIISTNEDHYMKSRCRPSLKLGQQCSLVTGPGSISAIRQTIFQDTDGRPTLEVAKDFEEGGQVIDDNGTWMFDIPMNLDYVITNEFGEQVLSLDPKKGIPTKGKYRFKIKWNQSPDMGEEIKRGYFLVPNIKEYGWNTSGGKDPLTNQSAGDLGNFGNLDNPCTDASSKLPNTKEAKMAHASYAFSLNWDDYGYTGTTVTDTQYQVGLDMIQEAIDCKDRFIEMRYNKVYTVSQLMSEYRRGDSNNRIIAIKNILDDACDSTNNKFPSNDGMYRLDIIYLLFLVAMFVVYPILFILVFLVHLFLWILCNIILPLIRFLKGVVCTLADGICRIANVSVGWGRPFGFLDGLCNKLREACNSLTDMVARIEKICEESNLKLPMLTYPDCELCGCEPEPPKQGQPEGGNALAAFNTSQGSNSVLADFTDSGRYIGPYNNSGQFQNPGASSGYFNNFKSPDDNLFISGIYVKTPKSWDTRSIPTFVDNPGDDCSSIGKRGAYVQSTDLPWHERVNLFNLKSKYFERSNNNPGGGVNRIKVRFNVDKNGGPLPNNNSMTGTFHEDNVLAIFIDDSESQNFKVGNMLTTVDPQFSQDINLTGVTIPNDYGTNSITGTTIGVPIPGNDPKLRQSQYIVKYSNPNYSPGQPAELQTTYVITASTATTTYHKFGMDLEYFQVIENVSVTEYLNNVQTYVGNGDLPNSFLTRIVNAGYYQFGTARCGYSSLYRATNNTFQAPCLSSRTGTGLNTGGIPGPIRDYFKDFSKVRVVFMVRGVDPNSTRTTVSYDLSKLYGSKDYGKVVRTLPKMKLNIPINGGFKNVRHNLSKSTDGDSYSGMKLYYDSFSWEPSRNSLGVPVEIDPATKFDINGNPQTGTNYDPVTNDPKYRPVGYCNFSGFSTNQHRYYSAMDSAWNTNVNYRNLTTSTSDSFYGLRMNGSTSSKNLDVSVSGNLFYDGNGHCGFFQNDGTNTPFNGSIGIRDSDGNPRCNSDAIRYWNLWTATAASCAYCGGACTPNPNCTWNWWYGGTECCLYYPYYYLNDDSRDNGSKTQNIYDKHNRGYYPNEIIEGGSASVMGTRNPTVNPGYEVSTITIATYYYSVTYHSTSGPSMIIGDSATLNAGLGDNNRAIVMRTDRLPSSSSPEIGAVSYQSYCLHANNNFSMFVIGDDGSVTSLAGSSEAQGVGSSGDNAAANAQKTKCSRGKNVLDTFSCQNLIPLDCYYVNKTEDPTSPFITYWDKPSPLVAGDRATTAACYGNGLASSDPLYGGQPESIMQGGCYLLVTVPFGTLKLDWELLKEWRARMVIAFGACRNVFAHMFTNNWINGTLFAFSFKNNRYFTGINSSNPNTPYNCYCKNTMYMDASTNNFYYRSSPYNVEYNTFIGRRNPRNWFTAKGFGGNTKDLMFPTTIMDLGPRDIYTQEIVSNNEYDGYVMKNLNSTTFQDVSELLNLFILTRLINKTFMKKIIGSARITEYFSRSNLKIDSDYAQMNSINSELGVLQFDSENYTNCDIYFNGAEAENAVFGVFYSSNTQVRDYITPKRTIITDDVSKNSNKLDCAFEYIPVKTQTVPFYQWNIKKNYNGDDDGNVDGPSPPDSIFGSQVNEWDTNGYSAQTAFLTYDYQKLDRIDTNSRYFRTKGSSLLKYYKGYIYSVEAGTEEHDGDIQFWDKNSVPPDSESAVSRVVNTGAPFFFYFGLNKGKSAFDRFTRKWIETDFDIE